MSASVLFFSVQFISTISGSILNSLVSFFFLFFGGRCVLPQQWTVPSPISVLYIPNQSADGEMKTRAGSPRVASYDMMMRLCHDLMTDATLAGLSFLRQNTKCQRQRGSKGEGVSRWKSLRRRMFFAPQSKINLQFNKNVLFIFGSDSDDNIPFYSTQGQHAQM